ncbi:hypothetical protein JNL27_16520 [bacterium]|nr:hypothetical protein [bacterium]
MTLFNTPSCIELDQDCQRWSHLVWNAAIVIEDRNKAEGKDPLHCECDSCKKEFRHSNKHVIGLVFDLIERGWRPVDVTEYTRMNKVVSIHRDMRCPQCCKKNMKNIPWCTAMENDKENQSKLKL